MRNNFFRANSVVSSPCQNSFWGLLERDIFDKGIYPKEGYTYECRNKDFLYIGNVLIDNRSTYARLFRRS